MCPTLSKLCISVVLVAVLQACRTERGARQEAAPDETTEGIRVPPGMGHYCSMTWPDNAWALAWEPSTGSDPCGNLRSQSPGGSVARAGLYSAEGMNNVVMRCEGGVGIWKGVGATPLRIAFDKAKEYDFKGCVFTAAPDALPIFDAPFPTNAPKLSHGTGFDFAQGIPLEVADYGQSGSAQATIVDHLGRDQSNRNAVDNHDGHDWGMRLGTPILAVADGIVMRARDRLVPCDSPVQKEVYLQHTVGSGEYEERFVSYYAHFHAYVVVTGQRVRKGQVIGYVGSSGCSSGPHLHLAVTRLTNTAAEYRRDYDIPRKDHPPMTSNIEPYGWAAPEGFDPWAWRYHPRGALSINLWNPQRAPMNPNF
ncbi:M23 family metallopeptidase [Myxococcus stipitatus]|uniref:M23 family metallopeptidase n=1 Tax=Myxococcus stipitatus TaxID=83455 RepID=UPI001F472440|nr:M23 family metallopeptidase [Myxococcus stipitatus]MCE9669695.1 M23 family metallopeptidase [Myxococcus stipitatus]